jgi:hypothetical protein
VQSSDAHAQKVIMGNGVIIPLHDFEQLSRWYYREKKGLNYVTGVLAYGITFMPNFMNFRPAIL